MRHTKNDSYWNQPTVENSYWAGFIAADGNIYIDKNGAYVLDVHLKSTEVMQLERLRKALDYTGNVYHRPNSIRLRIHAAKLLASDLEKHYNIMPAKSLILQPPNITDEEMIKAFIIGYIDGDGWISKTIVKPRGRHKNPSITTIFGIVGTSEMLSWIKSLFDQWVPGNINIRQRGKYYQYELRGSRADYVIDYLRRVNVNKMDRKWQQK